MTSVRKVNKSISLLLLVVFIATSFFNVHVPPAYAASAGEGESESDALKKIQIIPANGDSLNCVKLDGVSKIGRFAYYVGKDSEGNEKNYPTYCVEPNLLGVNNLGEYAATLTETVKHPKVYGAVLNGYPYKTLAELGVNTNLEGYYATRNIVWSLVKGWDITQWTSDGSAEGNRVLAAMQQIYNASKDYQEIPVELMVKVTKASEKASVDAKDDQYVSTTYTITANKELIESITVELQQNSAVPSANIVDMNNNPKTKFELNDDFKVIVLKSEADAAKDLKLDLRVEVKGRDNAIFYAKSENPNGQDYYAARDPIAVKGVVTSFLYGAAEPDPGPGPGPAPEPNTDGQLNIIKLDATDNAALAGAQFEVMKNGTKIGVYGTNSQGKIDIPINTDSRIGYIDEHDGQLKYRNMEKGKVLDTYTIKEIDPPFGYLLDPNNVQTATTIANGEGGVMDDTLAVTFKNDKYGDLIIQKTDKDTNEPLESATFRVTYLPGADDTYHFTSDVTTSGTGMASLSGLKPGSYSIQEIAAPAGYILDSKLATITVTEGTTVTYSATNQHKPGLEITKLDANELIPVPGVTFNIKGIDNSYNQDFTTDDKGKISLENLEAGSYKITETAVPPEYKLDPNNTRSIELAPGKSIQLVFYNEQLPFLEINKVDKANKKPLAGVVFTISQKGGTVLGDYTTDAQGKIRLENLPEGWYTIVEKAVPTGVILDTTPQDVFVKARQSVSITIEDSMKPQLIINKQDSVTHGPVAGAKFQVWRAVNGSLTGELQSLGVFTTDANGKIDLGRVETGWYRITEVEAPYGYDMKEPHSKDVFLEADKDKTIIFENTPKSALVVQKVDADTGEPLAGAKFRVRFLGGTSGTGGTVIGEYTTSTNGTFIATGLEAGTYIVEETQAPENYLMTAETSKTVYISGKDQDVVTISFTNKRISGLLVRKLDSVTKQPLAGAEFKITDSDGAVVGNSNGIYVTDADGYIHLPNIKPGTYVVTEVKQPDGYLLDQTPQTIKLQSNETHTLTYYNEPKCQLVIEKFNAADKQPLAGATFKVTNSKGEVVGNDNGLYVTDATGVIKITGLTPGSYVITEVSAPDGFLIDQSSQTIKLEDSGAFTVTFYNYPKGSLVIEKLDKDTKEPLADAVFKVTTAKGTVVGNDNGLYRTDGSGLIVIPNLQPGAYIVQEVTAPEGYLLDNTEQSIEVTAEKVHKVTFYNQAVGGLVIKKMDAETKEPLADVIFKVTTSDGAVVGESTGEYRTDENGYISIRGLKPDTYIIKEIKAKDGYILDDTPKTVVIKDQKTYTVEFFNHRESSLVIKKIDAESKKPLSGAVFIIEKQNGERIGEYETDENGLITLKEMAPDWYVLKEIKAPVGYELDTDSKTVEVKKDVPTTVTFTNRAQAALQIQKVDDKTGEGLSGAKFKVTKQNGEFVGEYTTDKSGIINIPNAVPGWYVITETQAPDGYILDEIPKSVEMKTGAPVKVTFTNKAKAALQIQKVDEVTGEGLPGAKFKITKQNGEFVGEYTTDKSGLINIPNAEPGWYILTETQAPTGYILDETPKTVEMKANTPTKATFTNKRIAGLQIKKVVTQTGEPLSGVKFQIEKMNGERVGTYETDKNGLIYVSLEPGYYVVREISAPKGYKMDPEPHNVEIKANEPTVIEFENQQVSGIRIRKVDADTGQGIYGVRFLIKDDKGNLIGEYSTDDDGYIDLEKELPDGKYKIEEIEAADGYIKDSKVRTITVRNGYTEEILWKNKAIKGQIQIIKRSADYNEINGLPAGSPLSGAVFEIINPRNNRVMDKIVTDSRGIAASSALPLGRYLVKEVQAPNGYGLNPNTYEVELKIEGDIVRFDVLNSSVKMGVSIKKEGNKEVMAGSQMYYNLSQISNLSNTTLSNFYWHDAIPVDAVTLEKVITGTYNQRLHYNVFYKTNFKDYRTLGSNLLTSNNYEFATTANALGLMSGEYVTDIRFDFGNVQPGFLEKEQPILVVNVRPDLPGEYRIVNKADVGGRYNNEWQTAKDTWVTIVYGQVKPQTLPKTGY